MDRVFKDGSRILSDDHSIVCVPLEAFDNRRGAIYAEASDSDARLDDGHLVLLTGIAAIAAVAFEHASFVEQLQAENSRLHQDLDLRHDLVGAVARI